MSDNYTELNRGVGGDDMDESLITYPDSPVNRKRARVVVTGDNRGEIATVTDSPPTQNMFGLVIRPLLPNQPYPGESVFLAGGVTAVATNVTSTVVSYQVPFGFQFFFSGFTASGDVYGKYELYINSNLAVTARSTAAVLNVDKSFLGIPPVIGEGVTIQLMGTHSIPSTLGQFQATFIGYVCPNS